MEERIKEPTEIWFDELQAEAKKDRIRWWLAMADITLGEWWWQLTHWKKGGDSQS